MLLDSGGVVLFSDFMGLECSSFTKVQWFRLEPAESSQPLYTV
jgi:hypothetical protein